MKSISLLTGQSLIAGSVPSTAAIPLTQFVSDGMAPREVVRHILLGSPDAVQQTIHLLHRLHYTETGLWSPVMTVSEPLMITPAQGEAMSLLRKQV